jgi:hypothetical protein
MATRTIRLPKSKRTVTFEIQRGNPPKVEQEIENRGGAVRWRTVKLPNDRYMRVAVVREEGPQGGKTVAGDVKESGE